MDNTIKTIIETECPHCGKPTIVEFSTTSPKIVAVYKKEEIEKAKMDTIERIKALSIDEEKKESAIKWVQAEETVFGPSEVDAIINNLLEPIE